MTQTFDHDGVTLAFQDEGEGPPILLIHGFASNRAINWVGPGWFKTLVAAGFRVIAIDNRGHGDSEKLYDPAQYKAAVMAEDARALLDHLEIEQADVMGYSMGARITAFLALSHPQRVRSAIFGGLGINMVHGVGGADIIAAAMEADAVRDIDNAMGRAFRQFADQTGSDRLALAACIRASRDRIAAEALGNLGIPVLVAVGTRDDVAGSGADLAAIIPGAEALDIPGRDHMVAVGDKVFKSGVLDFLARRA